jgi:hypothetical protein
LTKWGWSGNICELSDEPPDAAGRTASGTQEKLEKRRKYTKGEVITNLNELMDCEWVYFCNKLTHKKWFGNWQFNFILFSINRRLFYKAIKKENK